MEVADLFYRDRKSIRELERLVMNKITSQNRGLIKVSNEQVTQDST